MNPSLNFSDPNEVAAVLVDAIPAGKTVELVIDGKAASSDGGSPSARRRIQEVVEQLRAMFPPPVPRDPESPLIWESNTGPVLGVFVGVPTTPEDNALLTAAPQS